MQLGFRYKAYYISAAFCLGFAIMATTSRPFDQPKTGKIAVKVINHYSDEVPKGLHCLELEPCAEALHPCTEPPPEDRQTGHAPSAPINLLKRKPVPQTVPISRPPPCYSRFGRGWNPVVLSARF